MTERILPTAALPVAQRRAALPVPRSAHAGATVRPAAKRKEALLTTPARAGMLIGVSAAIYAVSLAGIAGLQAQDDAAAATRRVPYLDAIARARAANDRLEVAVASAETQLETLGTAYGQTGAALTVYEQRLDSLAALVSEVQGSAAALPTRISLPTVTIRSAGTRRSAAPKTTATSGASGG